MKIISKIIITTLILMLLLSINAKAEVTEQTNQYGFKFVYSSFGAPHYMLNGTVVTGLYTLIAIKDPNRGYYVVLPQYYTFSWDLNNDILWAANYANQNGLAWLWGKCLQPRTIFNADQCTSDPLMYNGY